MMRKEITNLNEYIATEFADDEQLIGRLSREMKDSLTMFAEQSFFAPTGGWFYEVGDTDTLPINQEFSVSTNAMIAHAVSTIFDTISDSTLCPKLEWFSKPDFGFGLQLERAIVLLAGYIEDHEEITSGTYGENDPFTLQWLLELSLTKEGIPRDWAPKLNKIVNSALTEWVQRLKSGKPLLHSPKSEAKNEFSEHAFPAARVAHICHHLRKTCKNKDELPKDLAELEKLLLEFLQKRLNECLTEAYLGRYEFDAAEALFAADGCLHLDSSITTKECIDKIFSIFSASESAPASSPWIPRKAFVRTKQGLALRPLAVEVFMSLLRICGLMDREDHDLSVRLFADHRSIFDDYSRWLLTRIVKGETYGKRQYKFTGWYSEHSFAPGRIHFWETAVVLCYVVSYIAFVYRHRAHRTLKLAGLRQVKRDRTKLVEDLDGKRYWNCYKQMYEPLQSWGDHACVYSEIRDNFLKPRIPLAKDSKYYSMLLYGPPGTGKTSVAEALAESLDWPLVTITPSDFVIEGDAMVESRAKNLFFALQQQRDIVVLFDEIDQLIMDRNSEQHGKQGDMLRLMTPSMLVKLQDLRDKKELIFIVATNYEQRIDRAIKRKGRFDAHYLISLPNREYRKTLLARMIGSALIETDFNKLKEANPLTEDPFFVQSAIGTVEIFGEDGERKNLLTELLDFVTSGNDSNASRALNKIAENTVMQGWGDLKQHARNVIKELTAVNVSLLTVAAEKIAASIERSFALFDDLDSLTTQTQMSEIQIPENLVNFLLLSEIPGAFKEYADTVTDQSKLRKHCNMMISKLPQFKTNCDIFYSIGAQDMVDKLKQAEALIPTSN